MLLSIEREAGKSAMEIFFFFGPRKTFSLFYSALKRIHSCSLSNKNVKHLSKFGGCWKGIVLQCVVFRTICLMWQHKAVSSRGIEFCTRLELCTPNFAHTDVVAKYLDKLNEEVTEEGTCLQEIECACHPSLCVSVLR